MVRTYENFVIFVGERLKPIRKSAKVSAEGYTRINSVNDINVPYPVNLAIVKVNGELDPLDNCVGRIGCPAHYPIMLEELQPLPKQESKGEKITALQ